MARKLDLNSSSQRWTDGSRAICGDDEEENLDNTEKIDINAIPDSQVPPNSDDDELYDNIPQTIISSNTDRKKSDDSDDTENSFENRIALKRTNSLAVDVAEKVLDSLDMKHVVKGTHIHVRNGKIHLCSMSPFESNTDGLIEDREKVIKTYMDQMERQSFDTIYDLFQKDKQPLSEPLKRKFKKKYATSLFNVSSYQKFSYDCLTLHDCENLRLYLISGFNIFPCKCKMKNCFNFNHFLPQN